MKKQFTQFAENIRLTESQENDAKTKYDGVCTKLHTSYYCTEYDGKTKLLFGSYKTKTNVRPITENQDVDVLFKIPKATYDKFQAYVNNGPCALLQEVKGILEKKYPETDIKAFGKIVKVSFKGNLHNVEVLPAYEEEDGTFTIPNSENGGSWDKFNPREQIALFQSSNCATNGLTVELARMVKTWVANNLTCNYKSYKLLGDVMQCLKYNFEAGADYSEYSNVVKTFFEYLNDNCDENIQSFVKTALDRAKKAYDFEKDEKPKEASEEWRKIFGFEGKSEFPLVSSNPINNTRVFTNPSPPYGNYKTN